MTFRTRSTFMLGVLAVLIALVGTGCSSGGSAITDPPDTGPASSTSSASSTSAPSKSTPNGKDPKRVTVHIEDFAFNPAIVTVEPGTTITFINDDNVDHTATASDGTFDTGHIGSGESAKVQIPDSAQGRIPYICTIHTTMKATVEVQS